MKYEIIDNGLIQNNIVITLTERELNELNNGHERVEEINNLQNNLSFNITEENLTNVDGVLSNNIPDGANENLIKHKETYDEAFLALEELAKTFESVRRGVQLGEPLSKSFSDSIKHHEVQKSLYTYDKYKIIQQNYKE